MRLFYFWSSNSIAEISKGGFLKKILLVVALVVSLFFSGSASAGDRQVEDPGIETSDVDLNAIPPILDPEYRHRKKGQFEFAPYGGSYLGNTLDQTWVVGERIYYHFNNTYALGQNFAYTRLYPDRSSIFGKNMDNNNLYLFDVEMMFSNDAALRVGSSLVEMDFFGTLGVGPMKINSSWEPTGLIGGGIKIYPGISWLAVRIDVNSYLHYTPQPGPDRFDADVLFLVGLSFVFPTDPSPYEKK